MRLRVLADYSTKHAMEVMRGKTGDPRHARERHRLLEPLFHPLQRSTHALLMPPGGRRTYERRHAANLRAKVLNLSTFFAIPLAWCLHISTRLPSPEVDSTNRPEMSTWTQRGPFICETDNFDKCLHLPVGTGATCPPRARHSGLSTREMSTSCSVIVARRCPLPPRASARKRIRLRVQRFPLMLKTTTHSIWDQRQAGSR